MKPGRASISVVTPGLLAIVAALLLSDVTAHRVHAQAPAAARSLTAQEFRLTDMKGVVRARLACAPDGSPGLTLLDEAGKSRAALALTNGASGLVLYDEEGKVRTRVAVEPDGNLGLALEDKNGKIRAAFRLNPEGAPALSLHDSTGANRIALETQNDGSAGLTLTNKGAKGGAALVIQPDGSPAAVFKGKDGELLWSAP